MQIAEEGYKIIFLFFLSVESAKYLDQEISKFIYMI